ncbi:hypothetical protein YC2023_020227 [Brassica napus]
MSPMIHRSIWFGIYNNALGRPEKKKFIARKKSYHSSILISASLSSLPVLHQTLIYLHHLCGTQTALIIAVFIFQAKIKRISQ